MTTHHQISKRIIAGIAGVSLNLLPFIPTFSHVTAASLTGNTTTLSDARISTASSYTFDFSNISLSAIKCIKIVLSTAATAGSAPSGISTAGATYDAANSDYIPDVQTWTADGSTNGTVKITNTTGETPASATGGTVQVTGITNGSTPETGYFAQFSTYSNTDCSTGAVDSGVGTFIYTTGQAVSLTVNSTLSFDVAAVNSSTSVNSATTTVTTTDGTIPFGTVTTSANAVAAHTLTVNTNAGSGYTVYTRYTQAPTNGSHPIADWTGTNASPTTFSAAGTEAFGYTTTSTSLSGTAARFSGGKWAKFTATDAEVAHATAGVSNDVTTVGYQVGISGTTPAGVYGSSTVIYTATPAY